MAWFYLIVVSIFEMGWPMGFKLSDLYPARFWWWIAFGLICMIFSGLFLYLAQRTIPIATAYVVWTGIGAVGTFLIGIFCFGDSASLLRMFFALLILVGIIGLELTSAR